MTKIDRGAIYVQIGRLLQSVPDMSTYQNLDNPETLRWLGRAAALVTAAKTDATDPISLKQAVDYLRTSAWQSGVTQIMAILYRTLAYCELEVPAGAAGAFIPVGNSFDAFAAVSKILGVAALDILVVDPYLDESVLIDFGSSVPAGIQLRLLADSANVKPSLAPAAIRWKQQYGDTRPLETRLAAPKALHDRAIFVDRSQAWTLTQSLKDFAKRSPAEIVRADDTAQLKVEAYEAIWNASTAL